MSNISDLSGIQKFRRMIEEKIIHKRLSTFKIKKINELYLQRIYKFKVSMEYVFNDSCPNLKKKYIFIGIN